MRIFRERLAQSREIAVWGLGYLGYTEILRLQSRGFVPLLWDQSPQRVQALLSGDYPEASSKRAWSLSGEMPSPDTARMKVPSDPADLFAAPVHLFCMPTESNLALHEEIKKILFAHADSLSGKLLIFLSAGIPGKIDSLYVAPLRDAGCHIACAFREDWVFEEMMDTTRFRVVAGKDAAGLEAARFFFALAGCRTRSLPSIKAAEIMASAENMLQALSSTYLNQLATAFPETDIRKMTELLVDKHRSRLRHPSLGHLDIRQIFALGHLTAEDAADAALTLAGDVQRSSLTTLLSYADALADNGIRSVAILGTAPIQAAGRDTRYSPARILAEYLHKKNTAVFLYDPAYSAAELREIFPYAELFAPDAPLPAEAALVMTEIPQLRRFSQNDLDRLGWSTAKVVIDNPGLFQYAAFSADTIYHVPGDGNLVRLWN